MTAIPVPLRALARLVLLLPLLAGVAHAQQEAPRETPQRVVVTGSHIARIAAEGPAAMQTITRVDMLRSGRQSVAEVVRGLTADSSGSVAESINSSFAPGAAGVSLRGLGANATLVLLNGRRTAPYGLADGGQRHFVDLNAIPLDAVERIEVLKDGASALYGSDAIAGVVNIVLRRDFRGLQASATLGETVRGDGGQGRATLVFGRGELAADGYNLFVSLEARQQREILQRDRAGSLGSSDTRAIGGNDRRQGKSDPQITSTGNNFYGSVLRRNPDGSAIPDIWYEQLPGCPPDVLAASLAAPRNSAGGCLWDPVQFARIVPESRRVNLFGRYTRALGGDWTAYLEAGLYEARYSNRSRPSSLTNIWPDLANNAIINSGTTLLLPPGHPDNPYPDNPARVRFTPEAMPRSDFYATGVTRVLAGATGAAGAWELDGALMLARSDTHARGEGYLHYAALQRTLADGTFRIGRNFAQTPAGVLAEVYAPLISTARATVVSGDLKATRELGRLPGGPLALAVGADVRRESVEAPATPAMLAADIVGLGYAAVSSARSVAAVYAELSAPLAHNLELQAAVRSDRYSDYGRSTTPKLGFKYTPWRQLALRGTYAQGFRAPGAAENGASASAAFSSVVDDPLRCPSTGLPQDCIERINIVLLTTGNPDVRPERSNSASLGLVLEPRPGWSATVDLWRIRRRDEIQPADAARIVAAPAAMPNARIVRGEPTLAFPDLPGPILAVSAPYVNGRDTTVRGLDAELRARARTGRAGRFTAGLQATWLYTMRRTFDDGSVADYAGTHGQLGGPGNPGTPRLKAALDAGWERGPWQLAARVSHVGAMRDVSSRGGPCLNLNEETGQPVNGCRIASFTSVDLNGDWKLSQRWSAALSVRNVFDRLPPFDIQTAGGINFNPTLHIDGAIGRAWALTLRYAY